MDGAGERATHTHKRTRTRAHTRMADAERCDACVPARLAVGKAAHAHDHAARARGVRAPARACVCAVTQRHRSVLASMVGSRWHGTCWRAEALIRATCHGACHVSGSVLGCHVVRHWIGAPATRRAVVDDPALAGMCVRVSRVCPVRACLCVRACCRVCTRACERASVRVRACACACACVLVRARMLSRVYACVRMRAVSRTVALQAMSRVFKRQLMPWHDALPQVRSTVGPQPQSPPVCRDCRPPQLPLASASFPRLTARNGQAVADA
jgi:hypothetical protein